MNWRTGSTYTVGRIFAVVTRPLCLFAANNYGSASIAQSLAVAFLATSLGMMIAAAGPHRKFYAMHFSPNPVNGVNFYIYVTSVVILCLGGGLVAAAVTLYFTASLALALSVAVYFLAEKLGDELLRLRLFERNLPQWGHSNVIRSLLQIGGLGILLLLPRGSLPAWAPVLILAAGGFLTFVPQLPASLWRNRRHFRSAIGAWLLHRAFLSLTANWLLWVVAVLSTGVGYIDRILALALDQATLPLFSLVVMCFSVVQMSVDFYYFSPHRRDFLEQRITFGKALVSRRFLTSLCAGAGVASVLCLLVLYFSHGGSGFPMAYVLVIAALQILCALAAIPREVLFWSSMIGWILWIELAFWAMVAGAVLCRIVMGLTPVSVFLLVLICALLRVMLYASGNARLEKQSPRES